MEIQIKNEDEKRAEQAAVLFVYGVNFTDCLRINGIATELEVEGKVIQAHRVYGAWGAFLIAIGEVTGELTTTTTRTGNILEKPVVKQPTVLTNEAERLREKMFDWIRSSYGKAYKEIKTEEEMAWLRQVIRFVVYQRIMENKYHQWVTRARALRMKPLRVRSRRSIASASTDWERCPLLKRWHRLRTGSKPYERGDTDPLWRICGPVVG
jgi:hypothetical protein